MLGLHRRRQRKKKERRKREKEKTITSSQHTCNVGGIITGDNVPECSTASRRCPGLDGDGDAPSTWNPTTFTGGSSIPGVWREDSNSKSNYLLSLYSLSNYHTLLPNTISN